MDPMLISLAVFGLFLAGVIKGTTGLGYASCALPFLVLALGLKTAMAIVIVPAVATNFGLALMAGHLKETVLRFQWLYVAIFPGVALGVMMLQWVSQPVAVQALGIIIVSYGVLALMRPNISLPERLQTWLQLPTGFLNGVVTGLTGAQVMPLFPYMMALNLDTDRTVQAINLAVLVSTTLLAVGLFSAGILTPWLLLASTGAVAPALIGTYAGNHLRGKISAVQFRRIVLIALLLIGLIMLVR